MILRSLRSVRAAIVLSLLGCAARPRVAPSVAPPTVTVEGPAPAPTLLFAPRAIAPWTVTREPDGTLDVVVGPLRATVQGDRIRWGNGEFLAPIVSAVRGPGGWIFEDAHHGLAVADGFLGALRPLSVHGNRTYDDGARCDGILDREGWAWSTDGTGDPVRIASRPEGLPIEQIAFADARNALAIVAGGMAFHTGDLGATWGRVALGAEAAWSLGVSDGRFLLDTSAGPRAVPPSSGAPVPAEHGPVAERTPVDDVLAGRLEREAPRSQRSPFPSTNGTAGPDGAVFDVDRDGRVIRVDAGTGTPLGPAAGVPADVPCSLHRWGTSLVAHCRRTRGILVLDRGAEFAVLPGTSNLAEEVTDDAVYSEDGVHALLRGACPGERRSGPDEGDAWERACVLHRENGGTRLAPVRIGGRPLRVRGDRALVTSAGPDDHETSAFIDLHSGAGAPVAMPATEDDRTPSMLDWLADDTLVATIDGPTQPFAALFLRGPNGAWTRRAAPPEVRFVEFADALRGMAVGATLDRLYRTIDGGATWERVVMVVSGDAARVPLVTFGSVTALHGECGEPGCWIDLPYHGGRIEMRGWGALQAASETLVAPREIRAEQAMPGSAYVSSFEDNVTLPGLSCREVGRAEPSGLATVRVPAARGTRDFRLVGPGGAVRVVLRRAAGAVVAHIAWTGHDAAGWFLREADLPWNVPAPDDEFENHTLDGTLRAGLITRDAMLLDRFVAMSFPCEAPCGLPLWITPAGMAPIAVAMPTGAGPSRVETQAMVPTGDGGVVCTLALEASRPATRAASGVIDVDTRGLGMLVEVGPDGRERRHRTMAMLRSLGPHMLVETPDAWALATWVAGAPGLTSFDLGGAVTHVPEWARRLPVGSSRPAAWGAAPRPIAHGSVAAGGLLRSFPGGVPEGPVDVGFAFEAGEGALVRVAGAGLDLRPAEGGGWAGFVDDGVHRREVRCN